MSILAVFAWTSKDCPIDSQDNRDGHLCIRPCDFDETNVDLVRSQYGKYSGNGMNDGEKDNFFIVFYPPKDKHYEASRVKCHSGEKQVYENKQCFCERPYTPYELELQRREKCDQGIN